MSEIKVVVVKAAEYATIEECKEFKNISSKIIKDELQTFYDEIGCEYIDIPIRKVGGERYCFICDESGALVDNPIPTATCRYNPMVNIFGTCIIAGRADENGDLTSLSDEEISNIMAYTAVVGNRETGSFSPVIVLD